MTTTQNFEGKEGNTHRTHKRYSSSYNIPQWHRRGTDVHLNSFFNIDARWGGWLTQCPGCCTPGKEGPYPSYRRMVGTPPRFEQVRKISPLWVRTPDRPACSKSVYGLRYPGPQRHTHTHTTYISQILICTNEVTTIS